MGDIVRFGFERASCTGGGGPLVGAGEAAVSLLHDVGELVGEEAEALRGVRLVVRWSEVDVASGGVCLRGEVHRFATGCGVGVNADVA